MNPDHQSVVKVLFESAIRRLDHSPRFRLFTLHGEKHLRELFRIVDLLIDGGFVFQPQEAFLLGAAICLHDLGMVNALSKKELTELFAGKSYSTDPAVVENTIREEHHNLVDQVVRDDIAYFSVAGMPASVLAQVIEISRCHRKVVLHEQSGFIQYLGAFLRLVDELDVGPDRAPSDVLKDIRPSMDPTSAWHWFKHGITERWDLHNNVFYRQEGDHKQIVFQLRIHPSNARSVSYWLNQIRRPILRALMDDGCGAIIRSRFGVSIRVEIDADHSTPAALSADWQSLEEFALSSGRPTVLLIDDESRKMDDLLIPTMDDFHVLFAANAKDAFDKLDAAPVNLAIVDLQIGSGFIWTPEQTADFKLTGVEIAKRIVTQHPSVRIGILTGTKHRIPESLKSLPLKFFLKKPILATELKQQITAALA